MTYRIKFVSPSQRTPWLAVTHERNIEAETFTDLLAESLSADDMKHGSRILQIEFFDIRNHVWKKVEL